MHTDIATPVPAHVVRNAELMRYLPLVRSIAIRVARRYPSNLEIADLVNIGTIGMIEALERFDAGRGVALKAFAELRVRGAMVDAIRKTDWVPREVRRRNQLIGEARRALQQRLGHAPNRAELAHALELSPEQLDALQDSAVTRGVVSLDAPVNDTADTSWSDMVPDDHQASAVDSWIAGEDQEAVNDAYDRLPDDERTVMSLYYEHGMKYREIGALMGLSESRVCQLRTRAVERIRRRVVMSNLSSRVQAQVA